jgi:hypothetical protein
MMPPPMMTTSAFCGHDSGGVKGRSQVLETVFSLALDCIGLEITAQRHRMHSQTIVHHRTLLRTAGIAYASLR